jgi:hypothetical protein
MNDDLFAYMVFFAYKYLGCIYAHDADEAIDKAAIRWRNGSDYKVWALPPEEAF